MRFALMGLLALGVVGGFGSGFASMAHWRAHHGGCQAGAGGWHDRWQDNRFDARDERTEVKAAPVPQTVVVQSPAPAAAPAPQVFVIMPPGAQAAQPQTIVVPTLAQPAQPAPASPATP